jgi:hypothetical protein
VQPRLPTPSKPTFLEKSGAVLVLPESPAPIAPPVASVETEPVSEIKPAARLTAERGDAVETVEAVQTVEAVETVEARELVEARDTAEAPAPVAAAVALAPVVLAPVVTAPLVRRARARTGRPRVRTTVSAFLRCRLVALGLLALVVASQPWWWNLGDLRVRGIAASSTQAARSLLSGECAGQPACNPPAH